MNISGSLIQAYLICPRQSWLMSRNLFGDQYNEFMAIGRLYSDESYKREKKEIKIGSNVIDVLKKENGEVVLIETKKSSRAIDASKFQLLYYIPYCLKKWRNSVLCLITVIRPVHLWNGKTWKAERNWKRVKKNNSEYISACWKWVTPKGWKK